MSGRLRRYRSPEEDSARWDAVELRAGDIVVSTRSKHGTTWLQMICAILVFGAPEPPAPLREISPWVDWLVEPLPDLVARLGAQRHRRFLKSHTPLDGLPDDPGLTYLVVARYPLDAVVSLYHQSANIDPSELRALTGATAPDGPPPQRPPLDEYLRRWIAADADPGTELDSLPGVLAHLAGAWARRDDPRVVLVRYADLLTDLDGGMRRIAARLGVAVDEERWPVLVAAATFTSMRARGASLAPAPPGVFRDRGAFFRHGLDGSARAVLGPADIAAYERRAAALAPPDLLHWLHADPPI